MEREWLFSLIPLLIGVSFLCAGGYGLRRARALRRTGITAVGRVVRHDTRRDDDGAKYHHPVVAWTTRDGRDCTYPSSFGRGTVLHGYGIGNSVAVLYDEENPAASRSEAGTTRRSTGCSPSWERRSQLAPCPFSWSC